MANSIVLKYKITYSTIATTSLPCNFGTYQSAYKRYHSTETALLWVHDKICSELDCGRSVLFNQLDLSCSFDTVDHFILLNRLESSFGITSKAISWLKTYLTCRTQSVVMNNKQSKTLKVKYGVPQGSVLGPLLFNLYINPVYSIIERHAVCYHAYADDLQIFFPFESKSNASYEAAKNKIEACINDVYQWLDENRLCLNPTKTKFIVYSDKEVKNCSLTIGGVQIPTIMFKNGYFFDFTFLSYVISFFNFFLYFLFKEFF